MIYNNHPLVLGFQSQSQVNIDLVPLLQALYIYVYSIGKELKCQRGGWTYFESCDISLENTPILHAASLALFMCTCSNSAMLFCHVLAYANVSPFTPLVWCCFFSASCLHDCHVL